MSPKSITRRGQPHRSNPVERQIAAMRGFVALGRPDFVEAAAQFRKAGMQQHARACKMAQREQAK